jgi:transcriptional regulator with PAS, ATPase and Fis domain
LQSYPRLSHLEDLENRLVRTDMAAAGKNVSRAARLLHLSRPTLQYRLERLGIG